MKIGLVTDGLGHLSFDDLLTTCKKLGIEEIELGCGNWSAAPHVDIDAWLSNSKLIESIKKSLEENKIRISAFNCSGNPLYPGEKGEDDREIVRKTFELASIFDVKTIVMMSGLPGGGPNDEYPNWIITSWPPETLKIINYQWNVAIPYWQETVKMAKKYGVEKIAIEPHGYQLVYNIENFRKLKGVTDDIIGFNLDPSHLFWMGADPLEVIRELRNDIYHVHIKDVRIEKKPAGLNTLLDTKHVLEFPKRSWNFAIPSYGHPIDFWKNFIVQLKMVNYDGVLSIEHEDYTIEPYKGINKTIDLLKNIMI